MRGSQRKSKSLPYSGRTLAGWGGLSCFDTFAQGVKILDAADLGRTFANPTILLVDATINLDEIYSAE
jgi:hypothetical protein